MASRTLRTTRPYSVPLAEIGLLTRDYEQRLELAKLKVVAGALGLPLGELTQRDRNYQLQKGRLRARAFSRADFLQGTALLEQDKASEGTAYLVRAIGSDPENDSAVARLFSALVYRSFAIPVGSPIMHAEGLNSARFSPAAGAPA